MLTFEDEVFQPGNILAGTSAQAGMANKMIAERQVLDEEIPAEDHRRVSVEDKRIINCKADVNQLVPFKYKWAWENTYLPVPITGCRRKST